MCCIVHMRHQSGCLSAWLARLGSRIKPLWGVRRAICPKEVNELSENTVNDSNVREAYMAKLRQRLEDKRSEAIFDVKEVGHNSQPFLIQCCIR